MTITIGVLLPRSTDFPAMGFDILDGLKLSLQNHGVSDVRFVPENIGYGEDKSDIYAKAEKFILSDDAQIIVGYLSPENAASLYPLMENTGKLLIALDPGMNYPAEISSESALHISLQGIHACYLIGLKSAQKKDKIIMATSFYDGGYRGPWAFSRAFDQAGGTIVSNFVGHHQEESFDIEPVRAAMTRHNDAKIAACFSTYLATTFLNKMSDAQIGDNSTEYYCSPYMAEEQTMFKYRLPAGKFYSFSPWFASLKNEASENFVKDIRNAKNKQANLFHLFGWEAGIVLAELLSASDGMFQRFNQLLEGGSYESPRGTVHIHPSTHFTYAPLYFCELKRSEDGKTEIHEEGIQDISAEEHLRFMNDRPTGFTSGWFNNYLCS